MEIKAVTGSAILLILLIIVLTGTASAQNCSVCHEDMDTNTERRQLFITEPNHSFELGHGAGSFWCLTCHEEEDREKLQFLNGTTIGFDQSTRLCFQCHTTVSDRWENNTHGVVELGDENVTRKDCVDCHDPHRPEPEDPVCPLCHEHREANFTVRELQIKNPDHTFELEHGAGEKLKGRKFWCYACHDAENRGVLELINGTTITYKRSEVLCSQCHAKVFEDWQDHIHGVWAGSWKNATPIKTCTDCHNPHDPVFGSLAPEPAPEQPAEPTKFGNYNLISLLVVLASLGLLGYAVTKGGKSR